MREGGDGHYQSIFASPLLPEQIARPRRDGDGNFDHARLRLGVKWGWESRQVPCQFGGASHADVNGAMGGEGEGGCRGPFLDGCRQVFLPSDNASSCVSCATRERRERDSSQLIFSRRNSPSPLQAGTVTSRGWATSDLEGGQLIVFLRNWGWGGGGLERE